MNVYVEKIGRCQLNYKTLLETFQSISFSYVRRQRNSVTHNLAKYARHVSGLIVWMDDIPPQLNNVLAAYFY